MFQEKYVNKTILFPTTQIVIDTHQLVQGSRCSFLAW